MKNTKKINMQAFYEEHDINSKAVKRLSGLARMIPLLTRTLSLIEASIGSHEGYWEG